MRQVDSKNGIKFLATVCAVYIFVGLFAYSFFMTSSPLFTANAVINLQEDGDGTNLQQIKEEEGLNRTIYIIEILFATVLFIWIVAYFFGRRIKKEIAIEIPKYKAFKTR